MRMFIVALFLFFFGCLSTRVVVPSYSFRIPVENSEQAWARAHAYLAKRGFIIRKYIDYKTMVSSAFSLSNAYVIHSGEIVVSREVEKNEIIIRINSPQPYGSCLLGSFSNKEHYKDIHHFIIDMMEYIKTGESKKMKDKNALTIYLLQGATE